MDITQDFGANDVSEQFAPFLQRLKKTKRPVILTVNGKAAAVVQVRRPTYVSGVAAQAVALEGIRQGREDVAKGRTQPAREALNFRRGHGLSR